MIGWSNNDKLIIDKDANKHNITVQSYKSSSCGKFSQTEFTEVYDFYCNFSIETKNKSVKNMELDSISLRNTSKTHKIFNNVLLSHEIVWNSCLIITDTYFTCDTEKLSGYYEHDEQWVKIYGF